MDDHQIVALFWARNEQAIAETARKYGTACQGIARNILQNEQDAEECVNDAYLAAWNTIPPESPDPLRAYLFRIVRNLSTTRYRANTAAKRNSHYDIALEELGDCLAAPATVEEEMAAEELARHLDRFLDTLDRTGRLLFVRRYWYSDSVTALAETFRMSPNRVSVRLFRLREKLRRYLQNEGVEL